MAVGIRHMAPSIRKKLALTSLTSGGRSVGIVRLRTEATEFFMCKEVKKSITLHYISLHYNRNLGITDGKYMCSMPLK
jgi:hypothetical protein